MSVMRAMPIALRCHTILPLLRRYAYATMAHYPDITCRCHDVSHTPPPPPALMMLMPRHAYAADITHFATLILILFVTLARRLRLRYQLPPIVAYGAMPIVLSALFDAFAADTLRLRYAVCRCSSLPMLLPPYAASACYQRGALRYADYYAA